MSGQFNDVSESDSILITTLTGPKDRNVCLIGLLSSSGPHHTRSLAPNEGSLARNLLWSPEQSMIATRGAGYTSAAPIWSHPTLQVTPISAPQSSTLGSSTDLIPYKILLWAKDKTELEKLDHIAAYLGTSSEDEEAESGVLVGLRAGYIKRYWEPKRYAGNHSEDGEALPDGLIEGMQQLKIDGPGGERIVKIGFVEASELKAIKVRLINRHDTECC